MAATATDKFKKQANNFSTTTSSLIVGTTDTSVTLSSVVGLPTDTAVVLVIDRVDANGNKTPSKREYVQGIVSGSSITSLTRGLGSSTAQSHSIGAVVEQVFDQNTWNDAVSGILTQHTQTGTHTGITTDTLTSTGNVVVGGTLTVGGNNTLATGWNALGTTLTYGANNGNKEFTVTAASDLQSSLSTGMKMSILRGTTPPTQSMAFNSASSQYASKASPTGITFTSAFTLEAWVYLTAYSNCIIGRRDLAGNNGWYIDINNLGQLEIVYQNSGNYTSWNTYQSLPLNQWVHVAGAVSSISGKTLGGLYINGVSVPTTNPNSAATSLTQTGALAIGASPITSPTGYFNGYISEARVWSVAQSQANIQANMAINLTGSESNLVGLWQGNGNFNDLTSNANNLTAVNGAIATQASNPYNATEYAVVTKVSYSSPTTTVTLYTGNSNTIPNQTLGTVYFSTSRAPYGFNADRGNWTLSSIYTNNISISTPSNGVAYWSTFGSAQINIPTGAWRAGFECAVTSVSNGTGVGRHVTALSTSTSTWINYSLTSFWGAPIANAFATHQLYRDASILLASITPHYFIDTPQDANTGTLYFDASQYRYNVLFAECAHL
jgi:hypothetical protein